MTDPRDPSDPDVPDDWFTRAFRGDYLRVYRKRDDASGAREAAFAARVLDLAPGARVLDLGCGGGRHSAPLAEAGFSVVGLDLSPELLAAARTRLGPSGRLVRADMRALPFAERSFDAVTSFFTSFGYFTAAGDDARVLEGMARVVHPGGGLLLDLPDRAATIDGLVPESERTEGDLHIRERRRITTDGARVVKEIVLTRNAAESGSGEERMHESVRLYRSTEIESLTAAAGWTVIDRFGDFSGAPWVSGTGPRMIIVLRRG